MLANADMPPTSRHVESLLKSLTYSLENDDFISLIEDFDGDDKVALATTGGKLPFDLFEAIRRFHKVLSKKAGEYWSIQRSFQLNGRSDMNKVKINGLIAELQAAETSCIVAISVVAVLLNLLQLGFDVVRCTWEFHISAAINAR
jgi:hypothetical protein